MSEKTTLLVCCGTGCIAGGALDVARALEDAIAAAGSQARVELDVKRCGCSGECESGPIVRIMPDDIMYYHVKPKDAQAIVGSIGAEPVSRLLHKRDGKTFLHMQDNPFYAGQTKIILNNVGVVDPLSLEDYRDVGGYKGLKRALSMTPEEIIAEVEASGLRGKGGAGFPTGRKWRTAAGYDNFPKYIVCNGDEGDPGAFMDGSIMEGCPHAVIEGMIIGALAIGAEEGILYIRDEYALARDHIQHAIDDAMEAGILGESILGTAHKLHLSIVRGGGAFVCGESTALMASIEGRVGEPRAKYIRSVQRGLFDQPTVLNNVETLASIPIILREGAAAYASIGTEGSKGTKVFALGGKINNTGLVEVPMGTTLRTIVEEIGGGIPHGKKFKAAQTGGPSGGCIPAEHIDTPIDYDNLAAIGTMMGSGGLIVMDEDTCMVDIAKFFLEFTVDESCGKCTPCRVGTKRLLELLTKITEGRGTMEDLDTLRDLADMIENTALCGLGQTAPNPVLSTLKHFRDEYVAHVVEKRCPAGVCKDLLTYSIDPVKCRGCTICAQNCPADAIKGSVKNPHKIDTSKCIKCGSCYEKCRFGAVIRG